MVMNNMESTMNRVLLDGITKDWFKGQERFKDSLMGSPNYQTDNEALRWVLMDATGLYADSFVLEASGVTISCNDEIGPDALRKILDVILIYQGREFKFVSMLPCADDLGDAGIDKYVEVKFR